MVSPGTICVSNILTAGLSILLGLSPFCYAQATGQNEPDQSSGKKMIRIVMSADRGGFGDVAVNMTMAEKLAHEYSKNFDIQLVVRTNEDGSNSSAQVKMQQLWPEYNPSLTEQNLEGRGGLQVVTQKDLSKLPPAYATISFSVRSSDHTILFLRHNAGIGISYLEMGDIQHIYEPQKKISRGRNHLEATSLQDEKIGSHLTTGAGQGGLYISAEKPLPPLSRAEVMKHLSALDGSLVDGEIAVAYSRTGKTSQQYALALIEYARAHPERNFMGVIASGKQLEFSHLPANLKLLTPSAVPFDLLRSLVAHADLPVLVGGDSSLSNAVDYEKAFFYEVFAWKVESAALLLDELTKFNPQFQENEDLRTLLEKSLQIDVSGHSANKDFFLSVFQNQMYQSEIVKSIRRVRKRNSLVRTVMNEIWLKSQGESSRTRIASAEVESFVRRLLLDVDPENLFQTLRAQVLDSKLPTDVRLKALRVVLEMRISGARENLEMVKTIFRNQNDRAFYRFSRFFAENISVRSIQYYLMNAARDSDADVRQGAIAVLDSIDAQEKGQYPTGQKWSQHLRARLRSSTPAVLQCLDILAH